VYYEKYEAACKHPELSVFYVFGLPGQSDIIAYPHGMFDNAILAFRPIYFFILFVLSCLFISLS
jgi:hypothetical protein